MADPWAGQQAVVLQLAVVPGRPAVLQPAVVPVRQAVPTAGASQRVMAQPVG